MRIADVLIIAGCLGAGYWIVSSIMGPGVDVMKAGRDAEAARKSDAPRTPDTPQKTLPRPQAPEHDWHIVLDVPSDASPRDIEAARKRRLAVAQHAGDIEGAARIQRAADWALRQKR
jgi:hypothetical protein